MNVNKQMIVELDADDIEKIVSDHVSELMLNQGYTLNGSKKEEPYPDLYFIGGQIEATEDK